MRKEMGLVSGRHSLPVKDYVFNEIEDVLDFVQLELLAEKKLMQIFPEFIGEEITTLYNEVDHSDIYRYTRGVLHLYVTGLTPAVMAVVNVCIALGVHLTLMHYDRETGEYIPQGTRI